MKLQTLASQHQHLSWLIQQAQNFDADQLELQAHWARYLCVLSSGFLENALKEVYASYARSSSSPGIANYVEKMLSQIQNPKSNKFLETAKAFNRQWEDELKAFLETDGRSDAIDSIMANRNQIAHGKYSGITLARLKEYLSKSVKVIEFMEEQCGIHD